MAGAQKFEIRGWMVALALVVIGVAAAPWLQPAFRGAADRCHPEGLPTVKLVKLDVCVDVSTWSWLQTFQTRVQKFAVGSEKVYLDTIGQVQAWPMDEYRTQVLQRANNYATNTETVRILSERDVTLGGKGWHMIDMQSDTASFVDYYYSADGFGSAELLFLSFNDNVPRRDALAAPVVASVEFTQ